RHRGRNRREDLQLAVHDVRGPHPFHHADVVVDGIPRDVHNRRHDRRASFRPACRLLAANSMFLVAPFHNVIISGVIFVAFVRVTYWFPKAFGFKLDEGWGKVAFWLSLLGFYVVFMPLYVAGLLGMTRRLQHYDVAAWRPWVLVAGIGIVIMMAAAACQVVQ